MSSRSLVRILCMFGAALMMSLYGTAQQPLHKAELLVTLPESCNTPDGMTVDRNNNVIFSCPNFNDKRFPGILMKLDPANRASVFYEVPALPATNKSGPMGLEFGPDGNLYLADNQYFFGQEHGSRVLRIEFRDGKPFRTTVVASGLTLANAIRVRDGHVYVTETILRKGANALVSGVYRFPLNSTDIEVKPGGKDDHLIATLETRNPELKFGADGMAFDKAGHLYVGNFGDGVVHKLSFDKKGRVIGNVIIGRSPQMKSADGLYAGPDETIYIADSLTNSIQAMTTAGRVHTFAQNRDTDGADGGMDQPCEVVIRGNDMIVSNFDMPFPGTVNTKFDAPYTLSVIHMKK